MIIRNTILAIGLSAGSAMAGTVHIAATLNDNTQFIANVQLVSGGNPTVVNHIAGLTGGNQMNFTGHDFGFGNATFDVDVTANDSLGFFLGDVANLNGGNNAGWFDGGTNVIPDDGTFVLAFGNGGPTNSNSVDLTFNPGVTAFGFNYDDVETSALTVIFRNAMGILNTQNIALGSPEGFISFVAGIGETIESITLTQDTGSEIDAFTFYGFQTVSVVPLPTAAFAGLGMLAGLGAYRRIRK